MNVKNSPTVSVIICTLNEAENIPYVLPRIPEWVNEVILVDGHSTDTTVEIAKKLCPFLKVITQPGKGKGDALKHGVLEAGSDIIVTLDADGQTSPQEIWKFVLLLQQGYDFAKGTRLSKGRPLNMPLHRWLGNKALVLTSNLLFGSNYTDICSGYNAFWKQSFLDLKLKNDGFELEQEMNVRAWKIGLKVIEVEHDDRGRLKSNSKVSGVKQGLTDLWVIIKERLCGI
jgi:glycosyltransferase involved in cell wall biosynthesis